MKIRKGSRARHLCGSALLFVFAASVLGCGSGDAGGGGDAGSVGAIDANLEFDTDVDVSSVNWTLTGPNAYSRSGTIDTTGPSGLLALQVRRIPLGAGYQIALDATVPAAGDHNGGACTAAFDFDLNAPGTVVQNITLKCTLDYLTGGVRLTGGDANFCPTLDYVEATPQNQGTEFVLTVEVSDAEADAVTYAWDDGGAGGTFLPAASATTVYTCAGTADPDVTITIDDLVDSDGAGGAPGEPGGCTDSETITLPCGDFGP